MPRCAFCGSIGSMGMLVAMSPLVPVLIMHAMRVRGFFNQVQMGPSVAVMTVKECDRPGWRGAGIEKHPAVNGLL